MLRLWFHGVTCFILFHCRICLALSFDLFAKMCESAEQPYKLSGCRKIETCVEPQAVGYQLTLGSLGKMRCLV